MFACVVWALLAPAVEAAAALPWALPEPTFVAPEADLWSPAPTSGPGLGAMELFRRDDGDNTCGFISGIRTQPVTCTGEDQVCATDTFYGVHGCCTTPVDSCTIPTTCIPSSLMSQSCTDAACSSDSYTTKCTASEAPNCYEYHYIYSTRTVMTQHGCAPFAFTYSAMRSWGSIVSSSAPLELSVTVTVTATASSTAASTSTGAGTPGKSGPNIGAIVGGVVGGLAVIGAAAFAIIYLILRRRKQEKERAAVTGTSQMYPDAQSPAPGVVEYNPAVPLYYNQDTKTPEYKVQPYGPYADPVCAYPGPNAMSPGPYYTAEADGRMIQEAPA
ncbi:hypothetical protein BS50DRAFT_569242 [Corynespora cassiicola Philippines]|uniref:Mid2 domain-containing protein n=1 Tax=Corynespora cassiicola Philippines TaxID=1448308 RepID=A0A2T2P7W1_CORCC|nr:hypothetical protein BS50DRAFT_569242 [Corynespora cassiicola Philippines]